MTSLRLIKISKITALVSFLCGTLIFLLYYLTSDSEILFLGYGYILLIGLLNFGLLISLIIRLISEKENRRQVIITLGLLLSNIPIMIIYCWISFLLLGFIRVNFKNATGQKLTNVKIIGCEPKVIDNLNPDNNKTVWIGITGDCSINLEYELNGQKKTESVVGYVTGGMGQKLEYYIGGKNNNAF